MTEKELYEALGAVATRLPEPDREQFAEVVKALAFGPLRNPERRTIETARRWLADTGWS